MDKFYITQHSIGYLGPAVLAAVIALIICMRMLHRRKYDGAKLSLALYFLTGFVYNLLNFIGFSLYDESVHLVWYLQTLAPFGILFLMNFAYSYPQQHFTREKRLLFVLFALLTAAGAAEYFITGPKYPVRLYGQTYGSEYFTPYVPIITGLMYFWTLVVFIRYAVFFEKKESNENNSFHAFFHAATAQGKTARAFSFVLLFEILYSVFIFSVMNTWPVSETVSVFITNAVLLLIYSLYTIIYLHSAYSNIPFIYKITGVPLVFVLIIVTTAGYLMMHFRSISYDEMNNAVIENLDPALPPRGGVVFSGKLLNDGSCQLLHSYRNLPERIDKPVWPHVPNGMQIKTKTGISSKKNLLNGKRYFLHFLDENFLVYYADREGERYVFAFDYREHLAYMDRTGGVILVIILISLAVIITTLPLLNWFGIIAPLHVILNEQQAPELTDSENELAQISRLLKERRTKRKKEAGELSESVRKKLDATIEYIHDNYRDVLSRDGLAAAVDLDSDYLSRLFKLYTGEKVGDYINNLRVEEACLLLVQTEKSVLDISLDVGFESLRTFNRTFTKFTGSTPTDFRKKA